MLERQRYPDLRLFPGRAAEAAVRRYRSHARPADGSRGRADRPAVRGDAGARENAAPGADGDAARAAVGVPRRARVERRRSSPWRGCRRPASRSTAPRAAFETGGRTFAPGAWIVPPSPESTRILGELSQATGLVVAAADKPAQVDAFRLKPATRIGLWRGANNMPGGWMKWLFEQYGFNHRTIASTDFTGDLAAQYDAIVLPDGIEPRHHRPRPRSQAPRQGVDLGVRRRRRRLEEARRMGARRRNAGGDRIGGRNRARRCSTCRSSARFRPRPAAGAAADRARRRGGGDATRVLRERSPAPRGSTRRCASASSIRRRSSIARARCCRTSSTRRIRSRSACRRHGRCSSRSDQAYRLKPASRFRATSSRGIRRGGDPPERLAARRELLRDQANVVAFRVGSGYVVTMGSQVDFRTQPRATFKLLFNAIFHGPSTRVPAARRSSA